MFANLKEASEYLARAPGMALGLDAMRALLAFLGNPERELKFIHITGTNGKGSVCAYLVAALSACGVKTGCYATPSVCHWRETISVDGVWIEADDAADALGVVAEAAETLKAEQGISSTRFELETAAALVYFVKRRCGLVVWEVGLGGRLDATNAVENTLAAVFTPITIDHMTVLGATVEGIAQEKAGILKRGCTAVSAPQSDAARAVLSARAEEMHCPIRFARRAELGAVRDCSQTLIVDGVPYETRMLGEHQAENLPVALEVIRILRESGFRLPKALVTAGIANAKLAGRFERIGTAPDFFLDGAHNPGAANLLARNLVRYAAGKKVVFVLGIFRDKDVEGILDETLACAAKIFTFDWDHPRAMSGVALADKIRARGKDARYAGGSREAVQAALAAANGEACVVAFGSLSHLQLIRTAYGEVRNGR